MPATFPATKAESPAERPEESAAQAGGDSDDAPHFILLDTSGPHPGALVLSFGFLTGLLILTVVLTRPLSATRSPRTEVVSEIVGARGPLWLPASPPPSDSQASATRLSEQTEPAESVRESQPPSVPTQPEKAAAKVDPPAVLPRSQLSVLPLAPRDVVSSSLKLLPAAPEATHMTEGDSHRSAPEALGTLPLPRLLERQAALAASLAALPANQRLALPQVSIRVNAEWLEALSQTQEKLYFSFTTPQADTGVLAYSPATHTFTLERPLRPLWQIRDGEQVPALAALRSAAARRLGVPPELVGLYTWHPPVLENALRMFVLARMQQMSVHLGPRDVVTVRLTSGRGGLVMNLEPVRAAGL